MEKQNGSMTLKLLQPLTRMVGLISFAELGSDQNSGCFANYIVFDPRLPSAARTAL